MRRHDALSLQAGEALGCKSQRCTPSVNTSVNRGCFKDLYREHEAVKPDKTSDSSQDQKVAVSYMFTLRRVIVF